MKEIFVPLEIAQKLREIGFKTLCIACYNPNNNKLYHLDTNYVVVQGGRRKIILAPTWEQVFNWFREKGYFTNIGYLVKYKKYYFDIVFERKEEFEKWNKYPQLNLDFNNSINMEGEYNSYQECQENLVLKLIELYKEK